MKLGTRHVATTWRRLRGGGEESLDETGRRRGRRSLF
jgi:hypothetical protein